MHWVCRRPWSSQAWVWHLTFANRCHGGQAASGLQFIAPCCLPAPLASSIADLSAVFPLCALGCWLGALGCWLRGLLIGCWLEGCAFGSANVLCPSGSLPSFCGDCSSMMWLLCLDSPGFLYVPSSWLWHVPGFPCIPLGVLIFVVTPLAWHGPSFPYMYAGVLAWLWDGAGHWL